MQAKQFPTLDDPYALGNNHTVESDLDFFKLDLKTPTNDVAGQSTAPTSYRRHNSNTTL